MYIDPQFGGYLLEPLFRAQGFPNTGPYAASDLGASQNQRMPSQNTEH